MERFARLVIALRWPILIGIVLLTIVFGWYAAHVQFRISISDLWPAAHPFIKVHRQYEDQYGSSLTVYLMVRARNGTIYDRDSLEKIERITRALDEIPGINHDQVVSITSRKVKSITLRGSQVSVENLVPRQLPNTPEEWQRFRDAVAEAGVVGTLVSFDGTASLIRAGFVESRTNLDDVFARLNAIQKAESDDRHEIFLAGEPVLLGWVRTYEREIVNIVIISLLITFVLLYLYIRNVHLTLLPVVATVIDAIWGLGFAGMMGYTLDPLIILIPALLMARCLSHGIQKIVRIFELSDQNLSPQDEARMLILALFGSGTLSIVADVLGLLVIAISSIPVMQHLAIFGSFWAAIILLTVLIFIPVAVSIFGLPEPHKIRKQLDGPIISGTLAGIEHMVTGSRARWVVAATAVVAVASLVLSSRITIGDTTAGTSLLWPDSPYNRATEAINKNFIGTDELYVIASLRDGNDGDGSAAAGDGDGNVEQLLGVRRVDVLTGMQDFQRYVERHPSVRRTFSYADFLPLVNRRVHGNEVKWEQLPATNEEAAQFSNVLLRGTDPGDFRRFVDDRYRHANVIVWLDNHRGETLDAVVRWIGQYPHLDGTAGGVGFQMASGFAGVRAAVNAEVKKKELEMFLYATAIVGVACLVSFRSLWATVILMLPLVITNFVVMAVMVLMGIGLDVNTLPIVSVGMGIGIDYGIYLLTRILQEIQKGLDYDAAISVALRTTGRAVFFTATIMIACVGICYFISSFRFMAEMGALLALVLAVNMLGALFTVPALISVFRPRFALSARLLVWD